MPLSRKDKNEERAQPGLILVDAAGGITNATTKLVDTNNGQRTIKSSAYAVWNAGVAYRFKTSNRLNHNLNLSVKNAFDKFYVQPNRSLGDRLGTYFSYSLSH